MKFQFRFSLILAALLLLVGVGVVYSGSLTTSGRCPMATSCSIGEKTTTQVELMTSGADLYVDKTSNAVTLTAATTGTATFLGADAAGVANTALDTTGAGTITIGSADVTGVTMTTDGAALNLEGTTVETLTLTATSTNTAVFQGADATGVSNTTLDTTGAGTVTIGSADVLSVVMSTDADVQIHGGATGLVSLDFRDYADTTDDDMAHALLTSNCTTATTGAEECDLNVSITTGGANIEVLAMDPAGGIEYGDATTTAHTFTSDGLGGTVVLDGSVLAQMPVVSQTAGAIVINTVTLVTAAGDYTIADDLCALAADIGNWFTLIIEDASTVIVINPLDAVDVLYIPGVDIAAGDEADSNSNANYEGAHITMVCMAVNGWYATSATADIDGTVMWIDGGSS